jgi:DNA-binding NtrC family response regulator
MASMTGEELLGHIRQRHPGVKVLFVTGHGNILDDEAPDWWTGEAHLTKPFDPTTLQAAVANPSRTLKAIQSLRTRQLLRD